MNPEELIERGFGSEFVFNASRSSGPGGQNINKVSTKVELRFSLASTTLFSEEEKNLIHLKLKSRITRDGEIRIVSQSERSQLLNKNKAISRFYELISVALTLQPERKATKPTFTSKQKRLENKKIRSIIKKSRQRFDNKAE